MPLYTTLSALSQAAGSNPPDGSVDLPSTVDDQLRLLGSFIAQLRDGKGLAAEADVASGATCDIGAANSPFVRVTGTTNITSFGTNYNGPRFLRFTGLLSLINSATLVLPGSATIGVQVGDSCIAVPMTGGGWRVTQYQRANAQPMTQTASGNGYVKLPGGVVVQWGSALAGQSGAAVANTFPLAFPTAAWVVIANHFGTDASVNVVVDPTLTTTQFSLRSNLTTASVNCSFVAIGN